MTCKYTSNKSELMECAVFEDYLRTLCVETEGRKKRKEILVFCDHCTGHTEQLINFRNTHIDYFPSIPTNKQSYNP
jgi:hypothetical protein